MEPDCVSTPSRLERLDAEASVPAVHEPEANGPRDSLRARAAVLPARPPALQRDSHRRRSRPRAEASLVPQPRRRGRLDPHGGRSRPHEELLPLRAVARPDQDSETWRAARPRGTAGRLGRAPCAYPVPRAAATAARRPEAADEA